MMRSVRAFGVVGALGLCTANAANAALTDWTWSGCGGSAFNTCASVHAFTDGTFFVVDVTNLGSLGPGSFATTFTAIGFANLPFNMTDLDHFTTSGDGSDWVYDDDLSELSNLGGQGNNYSGGDRCQGPNCDFNGVANGLSFPGQVTFYFDFTGPFDLTGGIFGLHGQQGPSECGGSTKLFVAAGSAPGTGQNIGENCTEGPPDTTIPEPITMTLLGTGLASMGGASLLRRRRKNEDEIV